MKKLLLILSFLFLIPFANAQITLKPGTNYFAVKGIILTGAGIQLQGVFNTTGTNYLNAYWNAYYLGDFNDTMAATCYLNCISETEDCSSAQQCNYTGYPGLGICTLLNPTYKFTEINNVTCKFFNPEQPEIEYKPYPYKTFYPINFEVFYPSITTTVGQSSKLQINVRNIGLFTDNYTVNIVSYPSNIIWINPSSLTTRIGPLTGDSYGSTPQTDYTYVDLRVLATIQTQENICFIVNSTSNSSVNSYYNCIPVRGSMASLSDFSILGIVWIMLISSALILFNKSF
jgi:hypothetical protein